MHAKRKRRGGGSVSSWGIRRLGMRYVRMNVSMVYLMWVLKGEGCTEQSGVVTSKLSKPGLGIPSRASCSWICLSSSITVPTASRSRESSPSSSSDISVIFFFIQSRLLPSSSSCSR